MADVAESSVSPRYTGTRAPWVEDTWLFTGRGTFVDDISRSGMRAPFTPADLNPCVKEAWHAAGKDVPDTPRPPPAMINAIDDALAPLGVTLTRLPASPASIVSLPEQPQQ